MSQCRRPEVEKKKMNYESKNLWNNSNKIFIFQRVSGIHICLFCCGIFVHESCPSPTCAGCDGGTFLKQGPLYSDSHGCGTSRADRSRTSVISTSLLHSDTNWEPLVSLPCLCLCFSPCSCLPSAFSVHCSLALVLSPASHTLQAENKLNIQPLTTSPIHVPFIPIMRILSSPFRPDLAHFTIPKSHQASCENLAL